MAVVLTFVSDAPTDLRAVPGEDDAIVRFTSPTGADLAFQVEGSSARVRLVELGLWSYQWIPSGIEGEIDVQPHPAEVARRALAASVPTSRLSSRAT